MCLVLIQTTLLLYKIQPTYWPALKSFLIFLNSIKENELEDIEEDIRSFRNIRKNIMGSDNRFICNI